VDLILFLVTQDNSSRASLLLLFNKNSKNLVSLIRNCHIFNLRARNDSYKANWKFTGMNCLKTGSNEMSAAVPKTQALEFDGPGWRPSSQTWSHVS
jgi:hypothetical protein